MSEERKPVKCPWCGGEMSRSSITGRIGIGYMASYRCKLCKISSPRGEVKSTWREAEAAAYLAATRTPPNMPLTEAGLNTLDDNDAVWIVDPVDGRVCKVLSAKEAREITGWEDWWHRLYFASNPTAADIEAARREPNG